MSAIRLECKTFSGNKYETDLDLMWDQDSGTVDGKGAEYIMSAAALGSVELHPFPGIVHNFSKEPLKSKADMAAIIGLRHTLPEALADSYPSNTASDAPVIQYLDEHGITHTEQVIF